MLTFNPGPSKITDATKKNIAYAIENNILEISHRSDQFSKISKSTISGLRQFFNIPEDYRIFYTSSATDAMQLSIMNCCQHSSFHFVNGAFSERFLKISQLLNKKDYSFKAEFGESCNYNTNIPKEVDFIALTHTETSTGFTCSQENIKNVRNKYNNAILAVDITSSAGATDIDIKKADIWLFSVQKCFGLPSGLGIIIVSPNAYEKSLRLSGAGINSFKNMWNKMEFKCLTIETPNILNIFLLDQTLKTWNKRGGLKYNIEKTDEKYNIIEKIINNIKELNFFIQNESYRSRTVICVKAHDAIIQEVHKKAKKENIILGKGYGKIKSSTFRIANFPAINEKDIHCLKFCF